MTKTQALIDEVLRLDGEAVVAPWWSTGLTVEGEGGDDVASFSVGLAEYSDKCEANTELTAHYRTACPKLARMVQLVIERLEAHAENAAYNADAKWARGIISEIETIAGEDT